MHSKIHIRHKKGQNIDLIKSLIWLWMFFHSEGISDMKISVKLSSVEGTWMISPKTTWSTTFFRSGKRNDLWRSPVFPLKLTYWIPLSLATCSRSPPRSPLHLKHERFPPTQCEVTWSFYRHYISHGHRRCIHCCGLITFRGKLYFFIFLSASHTIAGLIMCA